MDGNFALVFRMLVAAAAALAVVLAVAAIAAFAFGAALPWWALLLVGFVGFVVAVGIVEP